MSTATVTSMNDITLITLHNCPSDILFISGIFNRISEIGINVDMISLAPAHGALTSLSFTISDADLGKILPFTSDLHDRYNIKTIVSSGNCKISVYDPQMKNAPGIAAKVFNAAATVQTDIRIITTSEVEISLLVTEADFNEALSSIEKAMK
ncbi:MAG TPA: hypothetical protein VHO94_06270 [Oscillospiraceae bacterium]|nr:hypothetical protein [Oscillospiraceae bacterium]